MNREQNLRRIHAFTADDLYGSNASLEQPELPDAEPRRFQRKLERPVHEHAGDGGARSLQLKYCANPPTQDYDGEVVPAILRKCVPTDLKEERAGDRPPGGSAQRACIRSHGERRLMSLRGVRHRPACYGKTAVLGRLVRRSKPAWSSE